LRDQSSAASAACSSDRKNRCRQRSVDKFGCGGWSYGYVTAVDSDGRTIWIVDAHGGDGKRFIVRADEKLTAFVELERAIHEFAVSLVLKS
jgi:hypothetical protein